MYFPATSYVSRVTYRAFIDKNSSRVSDKNLQEEIEGDQGKHLIGSVGYTQAFKYGCKNN